METPLEAVPRPIYIAQLAIPPKVLGGAAMPHIRFFHRPEGQSEKQQLW